ncbi:hypothetical protein OQA88_10762 [Cercophora sp. LCS_1]
MSDLPTLSRGYQLPGANWPDARVSAADIVKQAYDRAFQFHREAFDADGTASWVYKTPSIQHVIGILAEAQERYDTNTSKRWRPAAVVMSWWNLMSSKVMQYERVIDTVISSNLEYAALVWGAMKFLFTVTMHREELSSKIAQAFAEIGAVLQKANFVAQKLYPTEGIQATLANVYAQIIESCIRATKWYDRVHRNPLKRVLSAVTKTWPLKFQYPTQHRHPLLTPP